MMQEEPAARNNSHDVFRLRQERRVGQGDDERIQYLYERHPSNVHSPSSPHYQRLKKARTLYSDDLHPYHENYYSPHDEGHGYHNPHPGFSHSSAGDPATTYSNNSSRIKSGHLRHSAYTHSISYNQDGAYYQSYQHQDQHPRYHSSTPDRYVVRPVASPPRPPPPEESSGDVRSGNRGKPRDNATEDYQTQQYLSSPLSFGSPCHTHNDDHRLGHHSDTFPSTTTSAFHGSADHQNLSHHPPPHIMTPSPFHQQPPPPPPPYLPHLAAGATTAYPPLDGSMYPGGDGYLAYAYPPPPAPYPYSPSRFVLHHPVQPPPYLQRVEYITKIKKSDILSGRGGATNSHSGNRAFRSMVKEYQEQYAKAKKKDKPSVAAMLVDKIRESGGRFLRRIETTTPDGQVLWYVYAVTTSPSSVFASICWFARAVAQIFSAFLLLCNKTGSISVRSMEHSLPDFCLFLWTYCLYGYGYVMNPYFFYFSSS